MADSKVGAPPGIQGSGARSSENVIPDRIEDATMSRDDERVPTNPEMKPVASNLDSLSARNPSPRKARKASMKIS